MAQQKRIQLGIMGLWVQYLASPSGLRIGIATGCDVGHRHGWNLALLWLWHRPEATVPTRHLAWEPPYAVDTALKRQKTKNKQTKKKVI